MTSPRISAFAPLIFAATCVVAALSASSIQAQQAVSDSEAQEIAREAYIYVYPLVLMDVTMRVGTNVTHVVGLRGPVGQLANGRAFPDPSFTDVVRRMRTRFIRRCITTYRRSRWCLAFPIPGGAITYCRCWTCGRIFSPCPASARPARKRRLSRLSDRAGRESCQQFGNAYTPPQGTVNPQQDMSALPDQVEKMDASTFFGRFAELMKINPPHANDYPIIDRMKRIGIEPGKSFWFASASPKVQQALQAATSDSIKLIEATFRKSGTLANGWRTNLTAIGTYGTDYLHRAAVAYAGLGANVIEDAVYPTAFADAQGQPFDSERHYLLHFDKDQVPPARGFWSLTMYDQRQLFTANPIDRYAIGDRDNLTFNPDGSLDLYIRRETPGKDKEANWSPAPASGPFTMNLRLYWPKAQVLDGSWTPPAVQRLD